MNFRLMRMNMKDIEVIAVIRVSKIERCHCGVFSICGSEIEFKAEEDPRGF